MSDYCNLFSQTFYGFLFSYLTITDVTSYVHHKFPVSFLLYIATKNMCQINHIITVNSSMNAPISETYSSQKKTLARLACLCFLYVINVNTSCNNRKLQQYRKPISLTPCRPRGIVSHNQNHFSHLGQLPLTGLAFNYSFRELAFTFKAWLFWWPVSNVQK